MFCDKCGTSLPPNSKFCHNCGSRIPTDLDSITSTSTESKIPVQTEHNTFHKEDSNAYTPDQPFNNAKCPHCGQLTCVPTTESTVKSKGFSLGKGCCGAFIFGPLGILCGACGSGTTTTHQTWWYCTNCGKKHMSDESAILAADRHRYSMYGFSLLLGSFCGYTVFYDHSCWWIALLVVAGFIMAWNEFEDTISREVGFQVSQVLPPNTIKKGFLISLGILIFTTFVIVPIANGILE